MKTLLLLALGFFMILAATVYLLAFVISARVAGSDE